MLALAEDAERNRKLAVALMEVHRHYPIPVPKPEHLAIAALIYTARKTYAPVVRGVAARKRGETPAAETAYVPAETMPVSAAPAGPAGWFTAAPDHPSLN